MQFLYYPSHQCLFKYKYMSQNFKNKFFHVYCSTKKSYKPKELNTLRIKATNIKFTCLKYIIEYRQKNISYFYACENFFDGFHVDLTNIIFLSNNPYKSQKMVFLKIYRNFMRKSVCTRVNSEIMSYCIYKKG